jgi:hypothetical protein
MAVLSIQNLLLKFGAGKSPKSQDYLDLIDTLADDRNAVYFSTTAPTDTEANPLWFNTSTQVLSVYSGGNWITGGGAQGATGPQGEVGPAGAKGDTGATGATGAAGSSGVAFNTAHISGKYYRSTFAYSVGAQTFSTTDQTRYSPILIPTTTTYDRIGLRTTATFSGTGSVRLGIYSDLNGKPDTVVLDAGLISPTDASTSYEITISQSLSAGFYWLAFNVITAATTNSFQGVSAGSGSNNIANMGGFTGLSFSNSTPQIGWVESVSAASSFATAGSLSSATQVPAIGIRVA